MKNIATIPAIDGPALDLTREDPKPATADQLARPALIILWDEEHESMAVMPGTLDDSEAIELASEFVRKIHEAECQARVAGRREEREKIQYGFRTVLADPLKEVARALAEELVERMPAR